MTEESPHPASKFELNNNDKDLETQDRLDIVSFLQLKEPISLEDQLSHASSLESLIPRQGSHSPFPSLVSEGSLSGSTSCSESSFEMASTSSFSEEELHTALPPSHSLHSFQEQLAASRSRASVRASIEKEVSQLDTALPHLDIAKLEQKFAASKISENCLRRQQLGEEVRRQLALQVDSCDVAPSTSSRQLKSSLGQKLHTAAMQLQVCYMNELNDGSDSEEEAIISAMRTSKSVPNFKEAASRARHLRRRALDGRKLSPEEREDVLRAETIAVQAAATSEGNRTVQALREARIQREAERTRHSRHLLSKMSVAELSSIHENIEDAIDATNVQLVSLLMAKDSLHMERDSILVDIGDIVEGHRSSLIDILTLLRLQDTNPDIPQDISTPV